MVSHHKVFESKTKKETNLQNPEVLDAREVHFSDSGDVVSVQIPAERNTAVTNLIVKNNLVQLTA